MGKSQDIVASKSATTIFFSLEPLLGIGVEDVRDDEAFKVGATPIPGGTQRGAFVKNINRANHSLGSQREVVPRLWGVCHPPRRWPTAPPWGGRKNFF